MYTHVMISLCSEFRLTVNEWFADIDAQETHVLYSQLP